MSTLAIESRTLDNRAVRLQEPSSAARDPGPLPAHSAGCRHSDQSGKSADLKSEQGKTAGITDHPPGAARHPDDCGSAGDDRGLRDDADLFADLRVRPEVPVQHWRPRQGGRCPHRYVDPRPRADPRPEGRRRAPGRGPDRSDAECASGRRIKPPDGRGTDRLCPGRSEAGTGQLHPLGVGIQAARGSRHPACPGRSGARRDLSPVRGGRRRPRPGRSTGLGDDLRSRHGDREPRQGPCRCRGRTRRPRSGQGRRARSPGQRRVRPDQGALRTA